VQFFLYRQISNIHFTFLLYRRPLNNAASGKWNHHGIQNKIRAAPLPLPAVQKPGGACVTLKAQWR